MATRENQGLQIGLIICVLVIVVLMVSFFFSQKRVSEIDRSGGVLDQMEEKLNKANAAARRATEDLSTIKQKILGFPQEAEMDEIDGQWKIDMTKFAENWPPEQRTYRNLADFLMQQVLERNQRLTAEIARVDQMQNERDQARKDAANSSDIFKRDHAKTVKDQVEQRHQFDKDRDRITKENREFASQRTRALDDREKVKAELNEQIDGLNQNITDLQNTNQNLANRNEVLTGHDPGQPDGVVTFVNHRDKYVYLDVGSEDGLRPRVTFGIYDEDETNVEPDRKKGDLEIVRVLGPHRSLARIVDNPVSRLILPRDVVYSPAWERGRHLSFGFAGLIDIDGDGESDRQKLRDIVAVNGGVIDADIDEAGNPIGELTIKTRYLIVGTTPRVTDEADREVGEGVDADEREKLNAVVREFSDLYKQAQRFSVERISVEKFLALIGWRERDKTRRMGEISRMDELGLSSDDEGSGAKDNGFRERLAPARGEEGAF